MDPDQYWDPGANKWRKKYGTFWHFFLHLFN
jgi:hypothetical protein